MTHDPLEPIMTDHFQIVDPEPEPDGRIVATAASELDAKTARQTLLDEGEAADLVILAPRDAPDELEGDTPTSAGYLNEATVWAAHARRARAFADGCERRRDDSIVRALELGALQKDAAIATGLSVQRVSQIRQSQTGP